MNTFETKLSAVLLHWFSIHEAEALERMLCDEQYTERDVIDYIEWCEKRFQQDLDTEFESWLDERRPRVTIGACFTEDGNPYSQVLEFPKRGEDLVHGTEFEWYYSLREITDKIMALEIGQSIPFKLRDDEKSVGSVTRLA